MRTIPRLVAALVILLALASAAAAQGDAKAKLQALRPKDYPTQPIEFVVVSIWCRYRVFAPEKPPT